MRGTLALGAALALAMSLLDVYVARLVIRRRTSTSGGARALRSFSIWWYALGATTAIGAIRELVAAFDVVDRAPHAMLAYATIPVLMIALWGLVDYLAYVHTGSARWRHLILVSHVALAAFFLGLVLYLQPLGANPGAWGAPVRYARPLDGPLLAVALALLIGPVLFVSAAYFGLAFRTRDKAARTRIFIVSGAFVAWFGSAALAPALRLSEWFWWPLVADGIALLATLAILLTFRSRAVREEAPS